MSTPIKVLTLPKVTVTQAGEAQPLSQNSVLVYSVTIQSTRLNTGYQYVGDSNVTSDNGQEFGPSDTVEIEAPPSPKGQFEFDLKDVYVDSTTNNAEFKVVAWIKVTQGR
jgi:hypothetical protein